MNNEAVKTAQDQKPQQGEQKPTGSVNPSDAKTNPSQGSQSQKNPQQDSSKKNPSQESDSQHKGQQKSDEAKRQAS